MSTPLDEVPFKTLAEWIARIHEIQPDALLGENEIIRALSLYENVSDDFFNTSFEKFSSLAYAAARGYNKLAIKILEKQITTEKFLAIFKADNFEADNGKILGILLDIDEKIISEKFSPEIQKLIQDFCNRKILALLAGLEGQANFKGVSWILEGHHNYRKIGKKLFQLIYENKKEILISTEKIMENKLKSEKIDTSKIIETKLEQSIEPESEKLERIKKAIEKTIAIMNTLDTLQEDADIFPILAGTSNNTNGQPMLHAIGLVIFDKLYLCIDRTGDSPGITIFEKTASLEKEILNEFNEFIAKVKQSAEGGFETALDRNKYMDWFDADTEGKNFFTRIGHIRMLRQENKNCTVASAEGLFLATLYSHLILEEFDHQEASQLSQTYSTIIFDTNKIIEIKKVLKKAITETDDKSLKELGEFLSLVNTQYMKSGFIDSDEDLKNLFSTFEKILLEKNIVLSPPTLETKKDVNQGNANKPVTVSEPEPEPGPKYELVSFGLWGHYMIKEEEEPTITTGPYVDNWDLDKKMEEEDKHRADPPMASETPRFLEKLDDNNPSRPQASYGATSSNSSSPETSSLLKRPEDANATQSRWVSYRASCSAALTNCSARFTTCWDAVFCRKKRGKANPKQDTQSDLEQASRKKPDPKIK